MSTNLITIAPLVVFGVGCTLLVVSHASRIYYRHVRRQAIDEDNERRAVWADKKVNSASWSMGAIGIALAIFGFLFLMTVSRSVSMSALEVGGSCTFGAMCLLRAWDVLHPTEARKGGLRMQIAAGISGRQSPKAPASKAQGV